MFIRENKVIMQKDTVCSINYCIYADQKFPDTVKISFFSVFQDTLEPRRLFVQYSCVFLSGPRVCGKLPLVIQHGRENEALTV